MVLSAKRNVKTLGQVFTPAWIVETMLALRQNHARILEPSAGNGAFIKHLEPSAIGIEIDEQNIIDKRIQHKDFFAHNISHKYETIIGNPPYVRFQDINSDTKQKLNIEKFDRRSNLYLFFIWKSIDHLTNRGELIFITPRDFLKATSAANLNQRLYEEGSFTHFIELGDKKIFGKYSPNCAIWRWVKGKQTHKISDGKTFKYNNGQIWFGDDSDGRLGDYFEIKVGAVSGADKIFISEKHGCTDFVCSKTRQTSETRRMIYNRYDMSLEPYKQELLDRRIRKFDETNWWEWGRKFPDREGKRIYVNAKTRHESPFFISDIKAYDGSILALFPKNNLDLQKTIDTLNSTDWNDLGFVCDGRLMFTQKSLQEAAVSLF